MSKYQLQLQTWKWKSLKLRDTRTGEERTVLHTACDTKVIV